MIEIYIIHLMIEIYIMMVKIEIYINWYICIYTGELRYKGEKRYKGKYALVLLVLLLLSGICC